MPSTSPRDVSRMRGGRMHPIPALRVSARILAVIAIASLAACTTPRGAGFQREVLAAAGGRVVRDAGRGGAAVIVDPGFAVQPVTRTALPQLARWPDATSVNRRWIGHVGEPSGAIIAPGDQIDLAIWDSGANSLLTAPNQKVAPLEALAVGPTGRIFVPYLGEMKVSGMAPETARARIEERLLDIIPSAQVQLSHRPGRGNSVSLVGGVAKPGSYPLEGRDLTVLNLISVGGGVPPSLRNPQITLIRGGDLYRTSVERLFDDPSLDTSLRGGDKVIVEPDDRYFLSLGAAGREALHTFEKDRVSALDALSIVGGLDDDRADPKGIMVLREYPARALRPDGTGPDRERVIFTIDLTSADGLFSAAEFALASGDLVYVTESPITRTRSVLGLIGSVFGTVARGRNLGG